MLDFFGFDADIREAFFQPLGSHNIIPSKVIDGAGFYPVGGLPRGPVNLPPFTVIRFDVRVYKGPPGWLDDYLAAYPLGTATIDQSVAPDLVALMVQQMHGNPLGKLVTL